MCLLQDCGSIQIVHCLPIVASLGNGLVIEHGPCEQASTALHQVPEDDIRIMTCISIYTRLT